MPNNEALRRGADTVDDFEECGVGERFYVVNSYVLSLLHVYCTLEFIAVQQDISSIVCVQMCHTLQNVTGGKHDKFFRFLSGLYVISSM